MILERTELAEYLAFGFVPAGELPVLSPLAGLPEDPDALVTELVARLRRTLPSEAPLPLVLTGDVPSGLLCALAAGTGPVRTFAPDAGGGPELARLVAMQYDTDHHDVALDAERLGRVLGLSPHPVGDPDALALLAAASEAGPGVVSAVGADELFGGKLRNRLASLLHRAEAPVFDAEERERLLGWRDGLDSPSGPPLAALLSVLAAVCPDHRAPYLDPAVASLAAALPEDYKVHGMTTLRLLRRAALPFLPGAVIHGPRASAIDGLGEVAREVLTAERVQAQTVLDPAEVERVVRRGRAREVWVLAALVLWLERAA
jgi:asparagine synthetase B (glutamine-hydrolysing)